MLVSIQRETYGVRTVRRRSIAQGYAKIKGIRSSGSGEK